MANSNNWSLEEHLQLPEDLRTWVDERRLVRLAFDALHRVDEDKELVFGGTIIPPGPLRTLLVLLSYSYAIGLYGSEEVESRVSQDPQLLYLSAKAIPSAADLRHFRRHHRKFLQYSLSNLLQLAWAARSNTYKEASSSFVPQDRESLARPSVALFELAAERRICEAILADTVALDN